MAAGAAGAAAAGQAGLGEASLAKEGAREGSLPQPPGDAVLMRYRGIEYVKIRGFWRARPGQGTGERGGGRPRRRTRRERGEPRVFWECVNERNGHHCSVKHRKRSGAVAHVRQLNTAAWRVGGRSAQTWEPFQVVDGVGYHHGVGAPRE